MVTTTDLGSDERVSTGVRGLDSLLGGGLVAGGVYLIMGRPGTGKTTLGNQACFTHVRHGARAVYVTLLAETHTRMLRNMASMSFFRREAIGAQIAYVGAYLVLRERKLSGFLQLLRRVLVDEKPSLLVLDGLTTAQALGESDAAMKEFVAELQVLSDMSRCTTIVLANMNAASAAGAEHSMVDGMIELTLDRTQNRAIRELEVLKFRGGEHLLGRHDMQLTNDGVVVRPRTEVMLARAAHEPGAAAGRRVATGIAHFDAMLGGGVLAASSTLLLGFSGGGKTLLAMHFLEQGARLREPCLYFGFYEPPARLLEAAAQIGLDLRPHVDAGTLDMVWQPSLRYGLDELGERLLDNVRRRGVRRVVIDGIDGFRLAALHPERPIRFITALANELRALDATVMLTEETQKIFGPEVEVRIEGLSALVDNIVLLEYLGVGAELRRFLTILKQRGSQHEHGIRELRITSGGVELAADAETAREILATELRHRRRPDH